MKALVSLIAMAVWLTACSYIYKDPTPDLVEAEAPQVIDCQRLGVVTDTADAGNLSAYDATYRMVANIKTRAVRMGATHIVWVDKNQLSATAIAYQCPSQ
jgi:N-acyl-L-homoserine lactone synthetase